MDVTKTLVNFKVPRTGAPIRVFIFQDKVGYYYDNGKNREMVIFPHAGTQTEKLITIDFQKGKFQRFVKGNHLLVNRYAGTHHVSIVKELKNTESPQIFDFHPIFSFDTPADYRDWDRIVESYDFKPQGSANWKRIYDLLKNCDYALLKSDGQYLHAYGWDRDNDMIKAEDYFLARGLNDIELYIAPKSIPQQSAYLFNTDRIAKFQCFDDTEVLVPLFGQRIREIYPGKLSA